MKSFGILPCSFHLAYLVSLFLSQPASIFLPLKVHSTHHLPHRRKILVLNIMGTCRFF